jgi:hypothetical protein
MTTVDPVVSSVIERDGAVLLNISQNSMTTLNATGAFVWVRLQRGRSLDEIAHDLARETNATFDLVSQDLTDFVEELTAKGLVRAGDKFKG